MKRILAIVLSLCLLLCVPMTVSAEEDPLTHFKGTGNDSDIRDYYDYLVEYLGNICGEPDPLEWDETMCRRLSDEMIRIYNEYYNDIDHPYLRGTINDETGEITVTGMRYIGYATRFYYAQLGVMDEYADHFVEKKIQDLVIPDEIDGRPVTKIAANAFDLLAADADTYERAHFSTVVIGDNVREIGASAFQAQEATITFGKNVETIGAGAFCYNYLSGISITDWGESLKTIGAYAFSFSFCRMPPLPDILETIERDAFLYAGLPETFTIPQSVTFIGTHAFDLAGGVKNFVLLRKDDAVYEEGCFRTYDNKTAFYCYAGSPTEEFLKSSHYPCRLIDGDSLLWDGEAVEGSALYKGEGLTEEDLRAHLSVDGEASEIQIDGLQDGKVVQGTTVTLFHTIAQAPGKVYTVRAPQPVSAVVETLPTKTNYIYKEPFDPTGLSLRVTYDNGDEVVVTDGITCTNTDMHIGANTITATYENVNTTFPVTVRYTWWQTLIRIFLFGFLWY